MRVKRFFAGIIILAALSLGLAACAPVSSGPDERARSEAPAASPSPILEAPAPPSGPGQLPIRYQRPAYMLQDQGVGRQLGLGDDLRVSVPVGADISSTTGPVPLRDILRRLAALKQMNISWSSDVDQYVPVDVDIRAEEDFFDAIDNILRQVDYFHQVERNTIVVKFRETRTFHVAMPFMISTYNTGVGGDVLGAGGIDSSGSSALVGNIQLTSNDNRFDIWDNIRKNLDQILEIWEETIQTGPPGDNGVRAGSVTRRNVQAGKGYYSIDKPIGLITVTAPRPLVEKIENYIDNLKGQLFRQISIEAKIIEVALDDNSKTGIDWRGVLSGKHLNFELFGPAGIIYPDSSARWVTQTTIGPNPFQLLLDAIEQQGRTNVLANPKISVMNGQPALITVGETFRYISEVSTTVSEGGVSTSVTTDTLMSGLGLAVLPTITENGEIVLSLTPVTSQLTEPIQERSFQGLTVQLPQINIRELKSIVKVRDGDTLMIGGLIDSVEDTLSHRVPFLGGMPGVGQLFRHDTKTVRKRELVILLQPRII
ncbi:type II and III secretion system protein [Desulfurivibrio sp. C05AmB]|jgi:MSHA type pilus biogenesis protein MshL|uniref:type II and III secretion system protein n=1 Tax=Desulfurivibrio sp. C05AmB TaxID=3374371 RepID=UPI00376EB8AE